MQRDIAEVAAAMDAERLLTRREAIRRLALLAVPVTALAPIAACSSTGQRNRGPSLPRKRRH